MGLFPAHSLYRTAMLWWAAALVVPTLCAVLVTNETYINARDDFLDDEFARMLGSDLSLSVEEVQVNDILMVFKEAEMEYGLTNSSFPPAMNFYLVKSGINSSSVYHMIKRMPKGAVLHAHDICLTSIEWVISELTYWDGLYFCEVDGRFLFRFYDTSDPTCSWRLVSDERANYTDPSEYDAYLFTKLSLVTDNPLGVYPSEDAAWKAFEAKLDSITGLVNYRPAWEAYLYQAMEEFSKDGVCYLEFRGILAPLYEANGTLLSDDDTIAVYDKVIRNFTTANNNTYFGTRFIYAPHRSVSDEGMWQYVNLAIRLRELYPEIVAGFDLVGQEDKGRPLKDFVDQLLALSEQQNPSVPFFFHAGETAWEGMTTDENLIDAVLLNTTRIGHAFAVTKHPKVLEMVVQKNIALEVCPVSNQVLMLVEDLRNHPMTTLIAEGYPIVISSDDPAVFGSDPLSHDIYETFMGLSGTKTDLRFLKKLFLNSIRYSSLGPIEKLTLEQMWEGQWNAFISSVLDEHSNVINSDNSGKFVM